MVKPVEGTAHEQVRLDKWLWAARFFKTRQIAVDAVLAGHVEVNGERAKPAKAVRAGDQILIRKPPYSFQISVREVSEKRGSATIAQALYIESAESLTARLKLRDELREMPAPVFKGRPTKKDRRIMERFIERQDADV